MSRRSIVPPRQLTLTEELERLEQSITLTLQEIDHNFSRAHRIVTSTILPVVENYARHSEAVWEGSKFWKQFFEASANVSLSSYAQAAEEEDAGDRTTEHDATQTPQQDRDTYGNPATNAEADATMTPRDVERYDDDFEDTQALDSPSVKLNLRSAQPTSKPLAGVVEYPSPYEALKREMDANANPTSKPTSRLQNDPATPGRATHNKRTATASHHHRAAATPSAPESSPFLPPHSAARTYTQASAFLPATHSKDADPLLHRVLDKNYRVQATPRTMTKAARRPGPSIKDLARPIKNPGLDSSPFSPALPQAPTLRSEIFGSPIRAAAAAPRTPGVSVQRARRKMPFSQATTMQQQPQYTRATQQSGGGGAAGPNKINATSDIFGGPAQTQAQAEVYGSEFGDLDDLTRDYYDDLDDGYDDDDDDSIDAALRGMSPPKTLQFHIPASAALLADPARAPPKPTTTDVGGGGRAARKPTAAGAATSTLLATPAREASRRIVEDLLFTAGLHRGPDETESEAGRSMSLLLEEGEEDERMEDGRATAVAVAERDDGDGDGDGDGDTAGLLVRGMGHLRFRGAGRGRRRSGEDMYADGHGCRDDGYGGGEGGYEEGEGEGEGGEGEGRQGYEDDDEDDDNEEDDEIESPSVVRVAKGGFGGVGRGDDVF